MLLAAARTNIRPSTRLLQRPRGLRASFFPIATSRALHFSHSTMASTDAPAGNNPPSAPTDPAKKDKKAEKERQKAEKAKKLAEKQAKTQAATAAAAASAAKKAEKAKKTEELPKYVEQTPKGEKKVLGPLDSPHHSSYYSGVVESAWYDWWEKEGYFQPQFASNGETKAPGSFVIPIPPPNVTGALHCGHALGTALQDLLIRWYRMRGFTTLYVPGYDHAGISTQSVIENMLWKKERLTRHDLGREKFLHRALDWKEEYGMKINKALRRLGGSFDWTREAYTMNPDLTKAVLEAFVRLHEDGCIYRGNRLVNWCVKLNTTLSNLEVDTQELTGRTLLDVPGYDRKVEFGVLTYFKYPIDGSTETIEIATTRPETMLGDTAIAVNPDDTRYKHLVGKFARHPFIDRLMPIVADSYVDPEFGTGAVKITPAHDANDFAIGERHKLEFINILNDDGTMNQNTGKYAGQKRYDARYAVTEELTKLGLFVKKEPNPMQIKRCNKSKDVIEPLLKPQWWMKMKDLAEPAIAAVRSGEIKIRPENAEKSYYRWLGNINDWCLSRQLWWGHRVPAWHVSFPGEASSDDAEDNWVVARNETEAQAKAEKRFPGKELKLSQDPDVLDTWFSSGLWPFATLGWPKDTHDMQTLFPTSVLETGWDILFFWVARMIMLSLKLTGKVPFTEVFCHSLIRDAQGRKMSKSLGNVIDPIDIMDGITLDALHAKLRLGNLDEKEYDIASKNQREQFPQGIPECGADALRFSLINYTTGGGDINFDVKVMAAYRRFSNKVYQATKYVLGKLPENYTPPKTLVKSGNETLPERWILHKLNAAARDIHAALEEREFSRSSQFVYLYWLEQLCDVYIENSKAIIQDGSESEKASAVNTLYAALDGGLTLIHPFMPFLSEELWQRLPRRPGTSIPSIMVAPYPAYREDLRDDVAVDQYEVLLKCSRAIRSLAAEYGIKQGGKGYIFCRDATEHALATSELMQIKALATKIIAEINITQDQSSIPVGCAVYQVSPTITAFLDVAQSVDVSSLITKTSARLEKVSDMVARQRKVMESALWQEKASSAIRDQENSRLAAAEVEAASLESSIEQFKKLSLQKSSTS